MPGVILTATATPQEIVQRIIDIFTLLTQTEPTVLAAIDLDGSCKIGDNYVPVLIGVATRGVIDVFTVRLEMPSLEQTFGNVSISSSGTMLAPSAGSPARTWIAIEDVQITPVVDGSGAVTGRLKSAPSPSAGPNIELLNTSGTAVTGHAFVRVRGY